MKFDVNICKQISFLFWTLVLVWLGLEATTTCTAVWCSSLICKNQSQSRFIHCILYSTMFFLGQDSRNYEHYRIQAIGITIEFQIWHSQLPARWTRWVGQGMENDWKDWPSLTDRYSNQSQHWSSNKVMREKCTSTLNLSQGKHANALTLSNP